MSRFTLHQGDSREILRSFADASVDSIVCDPPYHLTNKGGGPHGKGLATPYARSRAGAATAGFMGMTWDGGEVAHDPALWAECLRVAKPGAYLLAFGGTRTFHRLACAIEDAGWELRDTDVRGHTPRPEDCPWLHGWMFGSGFPKSHNGEWGGTAQKPAWEPIVCARKPLIGTVEENWKAHGTGALNIDACRIEVEDESYARNCSGDRGHDGTRTPDEQGATNIRAGGGTAAAGRWPANLIHDGSDEVVALFPREAGAAAPVTVRNGDKFRGTYGAFAGNIDEAGSTFQGDSGSAARFFYCAKATREDRNEGCDAFERKALNWSSGSQNPGSFQAEGTDRTSPNFHPTVKPTDLMRYLCRLVTPGGGARA
jgi:site-specific DNA-methyltransferase (adenine-specific)